MTEGQETSKQVETGSYQNYRVLCRLEEMFIGSTPQAGNVYDELRKVSQGDQEALATLLRPDYIRTHDKTISEVNKYRRQENSKQYLSGFLNFFEPKTIIDLEQQGKIIFCQMGEVDKVTGLVKPEWKIWVIDQDGQPNIEDAKALKLMEGPLRQYLELGTVTQKGYRLLKLNIEQT